MSYNGSGTFNINSAGQPVVTGTVITSTAFNALTADLGTGLTTALTKDGQTTPTANIPMGTFKITGLGAGTAAADAVRFSQLQSSSTSTYITAAGTDTITGTVTPTLTAYATGQQFSFVAAGTNTTSVTLNVDAVGVKSVTRAGTTALAAGDILTGQVVIVEYDGTQFQLLDPNAFTNLRVSSTLTTDTMSVTGATSLAGAVSVTGDITPTTLAASTDNWAPTGFSTASTIRVAASSAVNLTGIAAGADGRVILLHNIGTFAITLMDDVTSVTTNRFQLSADYTLGADQSVTLQYDSTSGRWRLFGQQTAAATTSSIANEGRLTLTTNVPVTTSNVTAATLVYWTPYRGNNISVYNGTAWVSFAQAQLSVSPPATTSTPFDVFYNWNSGTPTLVATTWTNDTTRATALVYQDGVLCKSGTLTQRYLGTCRTTTVSGQTEDSLTNRFVFNYYNRIIRQCRTKFSANRTTSSSSYVEINSEIRAAFVIGVAEDAVLAKCSCGFNNANVRTITSVGFDGTTQEPNIQASSGTAADIAGQVGGYTSSLAVGGHYATILGAVNAGTATWLTADDTANGKFAAYLEVELPA